jgi:hypothetical protein
MKRLLKIFIFLTLFINTTTVFSNDTDKPLTEKDLDGLVVSKSQLEEILDFFSNSIENNIPIDPDAAALKFGYKNFEDFAKQYLKLFELTDISVNEVREFLAGTDETVIIDQSQENLDKLYSLIINDKYFRKKTGYFKKFKKGSHKGNQINKMALAVYINYEKEMAKITKNPDLKQVSRFAFQYGFSWGSGSPYNYALEGCRKDAKKYKLFGGECIIIEFRNPATGQIKNMLKPNIELAKRMDELRNEKLKPKEKKKVIVKVKEKVKEPVITADIIIPVQVYLIQVDEPNFRSKITKNEVVGDFKIANEIWKKKGLEFKIVGIKKTVGNSKKIKKDLKWVKEKYIKSLRINRKDQTIKAKNQKRYNRIIFRIIGHKKNRNKYAINVFYIPYIPNNLACGLAYSYSLTDSSHHEINQLRIQNHGFVIMGEKSGCENRGRTLGHELGHMFSLKHKHDQKTDLMMWGTGTEIQNWQVDKFIKYHNRYLKNRLSIN